MVRLPIIALLALAPVAGAIDDVVTTADHAAKAEWTRLRLAAGDLAVDVLVVHARQSDLLAEFDALAETLAPADRAACKRSLAEAARLTQRAAGLKTSQECPSCHHRRAVVFYPVNDGKAQTDARLVCLDCCPRVRQDC
jgi:hypothetical protein